MTVLEFTNEIDGTINDFTTGVIEEREFRSLLMDTLIKVATPKLEQLDSKTIAAEFLKSKFKRPSDGNHEATFHRISDLIVYIFQETNSQLSVETVRRALLELGVEPSFYRMPYERMPSKGYWLESIK